MGKTNTRQLEIKKTIISNAEKKKKTFNLDNIINRCSRGFYLFLLISLKDEKIIPQIISSFHSLMLREISLLLLYVSTNNRSVTCYRNFAFACKKL